MTRTHKLLWTLQFLLAALFLFAGGMKLILPVEELTKQSTLPGSLLRFIGVVEVLGAIGLVVPGLTRIRPALTVAAAAGLLIVMAGAVVLTLQSGPATAALFPFLVGVLLAFVAWGRSRLAPLSATSRKTRQPAL
ncbi:MAG TPA: DoxX family protein [Myxococcales bacterium]|nr:DoxX family protein [Myxococcales bacterium]